MLVAIILAVILSLLAFTSLVINIIIPSIDLTMYTVIFFAVTIIGWLFISYTLLNKRRRTLFLEKFNKLDRNNDKLHNFFILLDFIEDKEVDMTVVKAALNGIYFSPSSMRKRPEKAKKKELFNLLIEYYLTFTNDKCKNNFIWDFNMNFFTWRWIGLTSCIGIVGIGILSLCYNFVPHPNDVLYTALYFFFGAMIVPLIAKFFGHII